MEDSAGWDAGYDLPVLSAIRKLSRNAHERPVDDQLGGRRGQLLIAPLFHLAPHRLEVALHAVHANRHAVLQRKVLRCPSPVSPARVVFTRAGVAVPLSTLQLDDLATTEARLRLDNAYEHHSPQLIWLKSSIHFAPLRTDPRFHSLLRRLNFPDSRP